MSSCTAGISFELETIYSVITEEIKDGAPSSTASFVPWLKFNRNCYVDKGLEIIL